MARLLGHAELVEKNLTATAELEKANAHITELETELAALKAASAYGPVKITELTGQVSTLTAQVTDLTGKLTAKDTELATLRSDLEKAKGTANAVIASQGLGAAAIPALDPNPNPAAGAAGDTNSETLTDQCLKAKSKKQK